MAQLARPHDALLGRKEGSDAFHDVGEDEGLRTVPGLVIYRFGAGLYYANATRFLEEATWILDTADPPIEWFCVSAAAMGDIDYSGAGALRQLIDAVKRKGAKVVVCEAEPGVVKRPNEYGLAPEIDGEYEFVADVIAAYDARSDKPAQSTGGNAPAPAPAG